MPRRGGARKFKPSKKAAKISREQTPYPVVVTPALDPPTINACPKKKVAVVYNFKTTVDTSTNIKLSDIRGQASIATGIPNPKLFCIIRYAHFWAESGASVNLNANEMNYGISAIDNGSQAQRAKVGFKYPKQIQKTYYPEETDITLFSVDSNAAIQVDAHFGLTAWAIA